MANTSISLTTATGGDARVLRFPGQSGSGNPGVATLVLFDESGRHVFDVRAEGEVRVDRSDRLGLTFSEHQPGQIAGYLEAEPWGTYERIAIDSGAVEAPDLRAIGGHGVTSLTLGWSGHDRYGNRHEKPLTLPDDVEAYGELGRLRVLAAHGGGFGDEQLRGLGSRSWLKVLVLAGTQVTAGTLATAGLGGLESLWISDNEAIVDDLTFLEALSVLDSLTLRKVGLRDHDLRILEMCPGIGNLDVRYGRVGRFSLEQLSALPRLWNLDLTGTRVGDDTVGSLKAIPNLTRLKLGDTTLTDAAVRHLGRLEHVDRLWLTRTMITNDGLAELVRAKPSLSILDISQTRVTVDGLRHLQQLPKLWRLEIAPNQLTEDAVHMLADTTNIDEIGLRGTLTSLDLFGTIADYIGAGQILPDA